MQISSEIRASSKKNPTDDTLSMNNIARSKNPFRVLGRDFLIEYRLFALYHLVELECISDLDGDISLEVDTTLLSFFSFDDIERTLFEIGDFS